MAKVRPLWIVAVALLGAAAALWGSTRVSWGTDTKAYGSALAVVALAAFAGTVAMRGWPRRVLGGIVALVGVIAAIPAVTGAGLGRWLALLGAVLLVAAGVLVIRHAASLPALGTRYETAGVRRSADPDRDMWDGLSHGSDPTVEDDS